MSDSDGLSYAILGTGALGGLYGGLLARAGRNVHFLLKSDYEHVSQHGLRVDSPLGDFYLPSVQCYASPEDMSQRMPEVDVAIVAWKTTANDALSETLGKVCGPRTIVLVLQNGLDIECAAAECVGAERVLGGCCFLCCNKVGPGHIQHVDYGRISFGEYARELSGSITPRMQAIAADFQQAGIDMQAAEDSAERAMAQAGVEHSLQRPERSAQCRHSTAHARLGIGGVGRGLDAEVCDAASRCGCAIDEAHVAKMLEDTRRMVPYDSSMRLDFLARRPMEVEAIFGNPLRAALQTGYRPSKIEMLYQQLCYFDRRVG